jgi:thioredoxin 1
MLKVKLYTSTKCRPCEILKPILASVCDELNIPLDFVWKENDKDNEFGRYQILSVPTMMITKNGMPLNSYVGLQSRSEIISKLSKFKEIE